MNDDSRRHEHLTPAEQRLLHLLELLRTEALGSDVSLTATVVRTAQWQLVVRRLLFAVGEVAALAADLASSVLRGPSATRRK